MGNLEAFQSFTVGRKVMPLTKDKKLVFVRDLESVARKNQASVFANLGMAAIEIISKDEAAELKTDNPAINVDNVSYRVSMLRSQRFLKFDDFLPFGVGEVRDFSTPNGMHILGAEVDDESDILVEERFVLAQQLSDIAHRDIVLPGREFFVTLGVIETPDAEGIEDVLDYANSCMPPSIDVYDVDVRHATFLRPRTEQPTS